MSWLAVELNVNGKRTQRLGRFLYFHDRPASDDVLEASPTRPIKCGLHCTLLLLRRRSGGGNAPLVAAMLCRKSRTRAAIKVELRCKQCP